MDSQERRIDLTINDRLVSGRPGMTILEAAREQGIEIPTLCYIERLAPIGACRLCVVEVEGSRTLMGSCHTPIAEGMVVRTHTPRVVEARRVMVELMLASHPESCLVCDKANICELRRIAADLDIGLPRFRVRKHYYPAESENPCLVRDMSKCVLCRRCVAGCRNAQGEPVFGVAYRGFASKVVSGCDRPVDEVICEECDECIALCPSGALRKPRQPGKFKAEKAVFIRG